MASFVPKLSFFHRSNDLDPNKAKEKKSSPLTPRRIGNLLRRKKDDRLPLSSPQGFVHKTHVDFDFNWKGQEPSSIFEILEKLGQGAFGTVYKAKHKESGFTIAVKVIPTVISEGLEVLKKEMDILKKCRNEYVVSYFGYSLSNKSSDLWILMEYCTIGSVLDLMRGANRTLNEDQIAIIMGCTLKGLAYIHSRGIIHRDLKCANILLTEAAVAKIGDFGVSHQLSSVSSKVIAAVGSPLFMSPEAISGTAYNTKTDIWSLGIAAIEMAEGRPPRANLTVHDATMEIAHGPSPNLEVPSKFSENFNKFVRSCLSKNPAARPSASELLNYPFVNSIRDQGALAMLIQYYTAFKSLEKHDSSRNNMIGEAHQTNIGLRSRIPSHNITNTGVVTEYLNPSTGVSDSIAYEDKPILELITMKGMDRRAIRMSRAIQTDESPISENSALRVEILTQQVKDLQNQLHEKEIKLKEYSKLLNSKEEVVITPVKRFNSSSGLSSTGLVSPLSSVDFGVRSHRIKNVRVMKASDLNKGTQSLRLFRSHETQGSNGEQSPIANLTSETPPSAQLTRQDLVSPIALMNGKANRRSSEVSKPLEAETNRTPQPPTSPPPVTTNFKPSASQPIVASKRTSATASLSSSAPLSSLRTDQPPSVQSIKVVSVKRLVSNGQ